MTSLKFLCAVLFVATVLGGGVLKAVDEAVAPSSQVIDARL